MHVREALALLRLTSEDASVLDIRAAFKRRALESHPDKGGDAKTFLYVMQAFEILSGGLSEAKTRRQKRQRPARRTKAKPANDRGWRQGSGISSCSRREHDSTETADMAETAQMAGSAEGAEWTGTLETAKTSEMAAQQQQQKQRMSEYGEECTEVAIYMDCSSSGSELLESSSSLNECPPVGTLDCVDTSSELLDVQPCRAASGMLGIYKAGGNYFASVTCSKLNMSMPSRRKLEEAIQDHIVLLQLARSYRDFCIGREDESDRPSSEQVGLTQETMENLLHKVLTGFGMTSKDSQISFRWCFTKKVESGVSVNVSTPRTSSLADLVDHWALLVNRGSNDTWEDFRNVFRSWRGEAALANLDEYAERRRAKVAERLVAKRGVDKTTSRQPTFMPWRDRFAQLHQWLLDNDGIFPRRRSPDLQEKDLARWVTSQRECRQKKRLPPSRALKLETLPGWAWTTATLAWSSMFHDAQTWLSESAGRYPRIKSGDKRERCLAAWIKNQRAAHANQGDRRRRPERASLLEQLPGWKWRVSQKRDAQTEEVWRAGLPCLGNSVAQVTEPRRRLRPLEE
eukprot:TRINITY_DN50059_c0_g1_i1.p1 TRINITY_DN50059_c0_g1~~TRINITY_DN50059_c0_g1_i1.p1  ORF type:complete len:572 (+),score=75.35 TRINITY_DN50059_c0_g1_i1:54-1769(+)